MLSEDIYKNFSIESHTPQSYWLMGCCGPFGILDTNVLGKITFPLLYLDKRVMLRQHDGVNCGVIWCLFIFDLMQKALVPYNNISFDKTKKVLPVELGIGKTWILPLQWSFLLDNSPVAVEEKSLRLQKEHQLKLFKAFREEMIVLLENLRKL